MIDIAILNKLNAPTKEERLANLREVLKDNGCYSVRHGKGDHDI